MKNDKFYMKRALSLARKGTGKTSPNPLVGAVIVKNGRSIGEGYHEGYGLPHAEVEAIQNACKPVKDSTLYCTLEPCSFTAPNKNNPPCTTRIIEEGIKRVVIAAVDPNPRVNGNGIKLLREAGIEVTTGVLEREAREINHIYDYWMITGLPFVHLKIAQSLDGRIATKEGKSKWITDEKAREEVHRLRSRYDAVLVGSGTVIADNPSLTVRKVKGRQPVRVVLDSRLRISRESQLIRDNQETIIVVNKNVSRSLVQDFKSMNIDIIRVEENDDGLNLEQILLELGRMNITSVLVEGGSKVFTSFLRQDLWNRVSVFIAPILIGTGKEAVGDLGVFELAQAIRLKNVSIKKIGNQVLFEGSCLHFRNMEDADVYRVS